MFIIIAVIVCIYLIALLIKLIKKPTETFVVEKGKIYQEEFAEGYIIRDETIVNDEIVPIKSEGEKVAKGESIYRYCISNESEINDKIEQIDLEIQNNLSNDDTYFSTDVKLINNQIDKKLDEVCESNSLKKINQNKTEISTYLTKKMKIKAENSNNETLKKLVNERNSYENQLNSNSKYITADRSGVISYRIDGLESSLKNGDFSYLNEQYLKSLDIKVNYMHSDIKALERMEIIRNLRLGEFDVLVGINLLREGLDIPEVSLVAILDADKEGFLRSERSLIQTIGRAARNTDGTVIMYADELTESMEKAITETNRRRKIQEEYNKAHGITPKTITKSIREAISAVKQEDIGVEFKMEKEEDVKKAIEKLTDQMLEYAANMEFEKAAETRDKIKELEKLCQ